MDFAVCVSRCLHGWDLIFVVDQFSKMIHFIHCKNSNSTMIANLFFKEIVHYHGLPFSIASNHDTFMSTFLDTLVKPFRYFLEVY